MEEKKLSVTSERFCRQFSLVEVQLATQDFSEAHLIGNGGFGKVYKGQIDDNRQQTVAFKRLAPNSNQGEDEFFTEIETLSKLRHMNLVSLIGYCNENGELILVYEYIHLGTLADYLYRLSTSRQSEECSSLTWKQRLNVCIGAGREENFTAKVSDFGLAKHLSTNTHVSTIVKGSFGYLDPSYIITCRLTTKSDTYAFGVVLLEVLCGRPAVDQRRGEDEMSLVMWAQEKISKGKADQIVASNLRLEISNDCLKTFVGIAKRCLNREPKKRSTMAQVVAQLEFALEQQDRKALSLNASRFLPFWNRVKPSGSNATGSTQQEHKQGDVNTPSTAIPCTQEEALNDEQTVNMPLQDVPAISIHEWKYITDNFSSKCLIDKSPDRKFYRVTLKSGQDVAIKELCYVNLSYEKFLLQVLLVSSLKHENLDQLLGYCVDGPRKLLAYEFAQNGSLFDILQGHSVSKPVVALSWAQRVKISIGAAKGLEYIHEKGHIHYNIRSSNVLVFNDDVVKLADFDLPDPHSSILWDANIEYHPCILSKGRDYDPPHTQRSDVYSFGLVLLELLTGKKLVDHTRPRGQQHLVTWAIPKLSEDKVKTIIDARMNRDYPPKAVAKMAGVAALCLQNEAEFRPSMRFVVMVLCRLLKNR